MYHYLPEDPGVVISGVKALVCWDYSVEKALAGVETTQTLDQPSVPWNKCLQVKILSAVRRDYYCVPNPVCWVNLVEILASSLLRVLVYQMTRTKPVEH